MEHVLRNRKHREPSVAEKTDFYDASDTAHMPRGFRVAAQVNSFLKVKRSGGTVRDYSLTPKAYSVFGVRLLFIKFFII